MLNGFFISQCLNNELYGTVIPHLMTIQKR